MFGQNITQINTKIEECASEELGKIVKLDIETQEMAKNVTSSPENGNKIEYSNIAGGGSSDFYVDATNKDSDSAGEDYADVVELPTMSVEEAQKKYNDAVAAYDKLLDSALERFGSIENIGKNTQAELEKLSKEISDATHDLNFARLNNK